MIAFILVVIGGLNWLLVGIFSMDVVAYLGDTIARIVYVLVGLSAIYLIFTHKRDCSKCEQPSAPAGMAM
jgi:uncharacterized membrane protein YuzA (DUF378 family)